MIWVPGAVAGFAHDAGFRDDALATAVALVLATSGGDDSFTAGPFPGAYTARLGLYAIPRVYLTDDDQAGVGDPVRASKTAFLLTATSGEGFEWAPEYRSDRYRAWLDVAYDAIVAGDRSQPPAASFQHILSA